MEGELPRSGHSYFGVVSSAQEAHAILEASKLGLLPRITRRLTDDERLRFVQPGAVFVWEEEEAGIRRWTDHIKWSPSRVSGAFLTYTEVPSRGEGSLIKQSFSTVDSNGTKMHLIAYTSKASFHSNTLPTASRDPLIQRMLSQRASGRDPREQPDGPTAPAPPPRLPPEPSRPLYTPNAPRYLAGGPGLPTSIVLSLPPSIAPSMVEHDPCLGPTENDPTLPSSYDSHPYGAASSSPFTAPSAPTASPFGPFARHLPPLEGLPPPANHAGGESPPRFLAMQGTFLDDDDEEEQAGRTESQRQSSVPRQVQRGSEDERQLRLLGRTL
ncbi:Gluconate transport-inducing protein [Rhodosporidiobolus nylandii]